MLCAGPAWRLSRFAWPRNPQALTGHRQQQLEASEKSMENSVATVGINREPWPFWQVNVVSCFGMSKNRPHSIHLFLSVNHRVPCEMAITGHTWTFQTPKYHSVGQLYIHIYIYIYMSDRQNLY